MAKADIVLNSTEEGLSFIKFFTSNKDYEGTAVNWSVTQDNRGVMYFGNGKGVLQYDGRSWRKIATPNSANVRSLTVSDQGVIYVCATNDFGFLEPDSVGQLQFTSLKPFLPQEERNYGEMWDVKASPSTVYFKTKDKIFAWNGKKITVIDSVDAYRLYRIGDKIYSRNNRVGLMQIDGDTLKLMPDGDYFAETGVFNMLAFPNQQNLSKDQLLITTNYQGLFVHNGRTFAPFKTEADAYLKQNQIYNTCLMPDGNFAFATQRGGVVIMTPQGKLVKIIDENAGLPTNVVFDLLADKQGNLWLATLYGIVFCEASSPFTVFRSQGKLNRMSNDVLRFNDTIFVANELGVMYLNKQDNTFTLVEGSNKPAYQFFVTNGILLIATNWGVMRLKGHKLQHLLFDGTTNILLKSKFFPDRIYVGYRDGFAVIDKKHGEPFQVVYQKHFYDEVYSIVELDERELWLSGYESEVVRLTGDLKNLSRGLDNQVEYQYYGKKDGLTGTDPTIYNLNGSLLLTTNKGVYSFDSQSLSFKPDSALGANFTNGQSTIELIEKSSNNNFWLLAKTNGQYDLGKVVTGEDGNFDWQVNPVFRRIDLHSVNSIYSDFDEKSASEFLWISTNDGLFLYKPHIKPRLRIPFSTLIRQVQLSTDSLIFAGEPQGKNAQPISVILNKYNDIQFEFSATSYVKPEANRFQYFLDGYDQEWSKWTPESKKSYTNLPAGEYNFRVRSKNIYSLAGMEDSFKFVILPPFYATWWAYTLYALGFILFIFSVDRVQRQRLIQRERKRANRREEELILKQAKELEAIDNIVKLINRELNLERLLQVLLEQGMKLFPHADNGAVLIYDPNTDSFKFAATIGYDTEVVQNIHFSLEEITGKYARDSVEVEKGIYVVKQFRGLDSVDKFKFLPKPQSLILMSAIWDKKLEGIVVFTNLTNQDAFNQADARKLRRFREHTISAIVKARILKELQLKNKKIISTQQQLITQEKLASLGQLTAGIAHEIKNPLNFVKNFSELSLELMQELQDALSGEKDKFSTMDWDSIQEILKTLQENNQRIHGHSIKVDGIVRSMLEHSRKKSGEWRASDINAILEENINLVYHGMSSQDKSFQVNIQRDFTDSAVRPNIIPQDLSRVFLNILQNAFYAAQSNPHPRVQVSTRLINETFETRIRDNGSGIAQKDHDKIFNPFFTTKPSGQGTGLGLSIAYDVVVKQHGGELFFETKEGIFTEFIIRIPLNV